MSRALKISNWLALIFFSAVSLVFAILKPSSPPIFIAGILPYGAAVLGMKFNLRRFALWGAVSINAIWALLLSIGVVLSFFYMVQPLSAAILCAILAAPCTFNAKLLLDRLYPDATIADATSTDANADVQSAPDHVTDSITEIGS
jgi:hypothetical protein